MRFPPSVFDIPLSQYSPHRPKSDGLWLLVTYKDENFVQMLYGYDLIGLDPSKGIEGRLILGTGDVYPLFCIPRCVIKAITVLGVVGKGL